MFGYKKSLQLIIHCKFVLNEQSNFCGKNIHQKKMAKIFKFACSVFILLIPFSAFSTDAVKNGLIYFYGYPFNTEAEISEIVQLPGIIKGEISIEWKDVFIEHNKYNWSYVDKEIERWKSNGKKVILRFMTANNSTYSTSARLIEQKRIRLIGEGLFTDFEHAVQQDGYEILNGNVGAGNLSIAGDKCLNLIENKEFKALLIETGKERKMVAKATYLVQFDYKIVKFINTRSAAKFNIILQSASTGKQIIESFQVKQGESSLFTKEITCANADDYQLRIEAENIADCLLDNINIIQSSDSRGKRVAFPNYFSPAFKAAYLTFMKEAAKKYANNATVDAIAIGGIGRWEEMLLNANEEGVHDVQQSIFRQWKNYGYTDVSYLKDVIEWSIDLSKKYFPAKEHILQLAPMNNGYENEDFIYRRAAAIAISRGVSIKQNGMSEKYEIWAPTSDPAYIMNRYRHIDSPKRYYETAGQIFRNTLNAMGHPLSLFNRVAIDGVNYLYLYKSDILEPNIQNYFPYFDSIIQKPLISKLYSQLGEYPLANRKKGKPHLLDTIVYHNNWLGIRHYTDSEANVDFVVDESTQKKGVKTNAGNSKILFDVDDRLLYNGLSQPVLTVEYLNVGTDKFSVYVLDRKTDNMLKVADIKKTNTRNFLLKSIPLGKLFDAYDNHREVRPEISIDDNNDGVELISSLEIDGVPVNEFQLEVVSESKATQSPLILKSSTDRLNREISLNINRPIAKAELVYFDDDFGSKTDIYASLQVVDSGNPTEVSKKQYYIGGDKEPMQLVVASEIIPQKAILSVYRGKGNVGVYAGDDGKMAYRIFSYVNKRITDFEYNNIGFTSQYFFNGVELPATINPEKMELKKILPDKSEMNIAFSVSGNKVYFQPQTKGSYKIVLNNSSIKPVSLCILIPRM